jgi:hypothetical protein
VHSRSYSTCWRRAGAFAAARAETKAFYPVEGFLSGPFSRAKCRSCGSRYCFNKAWQQQQKELVAGRRQSAAGDVLAEAMATAEMAAAEDSATGD